MLDKSQDVGQKCFTTISMLEEHGLYILVQCFLALASDVQKGKKVVGRLARLSVVRVVHLLGFCGLLYILPSSSPFIPSLLYLRTS